MDLRTLRNQIRIKKVRVRLTKHARTEALKDGLTTFDLEYVLMNGEVIEDYPERNRVLLLAFEQQHQLPIHISLEYFPSEDVATIVTAYVPDDDI
jgi:hypothetical protein